MKALCGRETKLTDFHIDLSGYSPRLATSWMILYLNPNACNRAFILLTTAQKNAPLLNMGFRLARACWRFIATNEAQLFALTARDAVAGHDANGVYEMRPGAS